MCLISTNEDPDCKSGRDLFFVGGGAGGQSGGGLGLQLGCGGVGAGVATRASQLRDVGAGC